MVFNRSLGLEFLIYALIAFCGYLSQTVSTPKLIIDRKTVFSTDIVMTIGKMGFFLTITIAYIVNYICCKISLINITCDHPDQFTNKMNIIITLITITLTTSIGCLYSNVVDYLSFLGGFLAVVLAYLIPTMLHVKVTHWPKTSLKVVIPIITTAIMVIIGWTGAIMVIINIITGKSNREE